MLSTLVLCLLATSHQRPPSALAIDQEVVLAMDRTPYRYLIAPAVEQRGLVVSNESIPPGLKERVTRAINLALVPSLVPPSPQRFIGFRNPPDFENEFLWQIWQADGRALLWSDLDPQAYLYIQLLPGELRDLSDELFRTHLLSWLQAHLNLPPGYGARRCAISESLSLPSGHHLRAGVVAVAAEYLGPPSRMAERDWWAASFSFWTDERMLCLEMVFPTARPREQAATTADRGRKHPYTRSRFDPPGN